MSLTRNLIAALLIAALLPCSVQAKTDLSDWGNVQRLRIGSNIVVSTKRGDRFAGELKHVDNDSLVLLVRVRDVMRQAIDLRFMSRHSRATEMHRRPRRINGEWLTVRPSHTVLCGGRAAGKTLRKT